MGSLGLMRLAERVLAAVEDERYSDRRKVWSRFEEGLSARPPVTVFSRPHDWATELGFNLLEYYSRPETYLEAQLKMKLYQHEYVEDDSVLSPSISVDLGAFEPSLLGLHLIPRGDSTPWPGPPVVRDEEDLKHLAYPSFLKSGLMPRIHEFAKTISSGVGGRLPVALPSWTRSPWGVAVHLMGWQNALLGLLRNPGFIRRLLGFIAEARIVFEEERAEFLGEKLSSSSLGNDEVNARLFSTKVYGDIILPSEARLADFYPGGISYFHSCADITPFLPQVAGLRGLKTIQVSPWTSLEAARTVAGRRVVLQRWMHPEDLILSVQQRRARLVEVLESAAQCRLTVVCAGAVAETRDWLASVRPLLDVDEHGSRTAQ